jgi:hypothetical protein
MDGQFSPVDPQDQLLVGFLQDADSSFVLAARGIVVPAHLLSPLQLNHT